MKIPPPSQISEADYNALVEQPLHIAHIDIQNVMRVEAVSLDLLDGGVVEIAGNNGAGKTSVLNAIAMALGGAKLCPPHPVRKGAKDASVTVDVEEYRITRTWSSPDDRVGTLKVEAKDGRRIAKPQDFLNTLIGHVSFDPHQFLRMEPDKQAAELKALAGLDFTEIDAEYKALYDERTDVNRDVARLEARLRALPDVGEGPLEEVSAEETMRLLAAASEAAGRLASVAGELAAEKRALADVEADIANTEARLSALMGRRTALVESCNALANQQHEMGAAVPDVDELRARLSGIEATNRDIRQRREAKALEQELEAARASAEARTTALEQIKAFKAQAIANAKFPVEGLGFDDGGVTLGGLPLSQASMAQQLRCAAGVALARNPRIRAILIRDGAVLDDDSMAALRELAKEYRAQVFIERIQAAPGAVVIADGKVAGPAPANGKGGTRR